MVKSDTVLAFGVRSTLERENDLVTIEVQPDRNGSLPIDLEQPEPDVVILEAGSKIPFPTLLSQVSKRFPQAAIILMNSLESWVKLYDHGETFINEPAELVSAIRNLQTRTEGSLGEQ